MYVSSRMDLVIARLRRRPGCIASLLFIERFTDLRICPFLLFRPLKKYVLTLTDVLLSLLLSW